MKILLGMSGGLDSTWAAHLLREAGHEVEGAILLMHGEGELGAARESAAALGIPLHVLDCRERFDREVVLPFAEEYRRARTPNPCILCNERVKFRVLYEEMCARGLDRIATGHYATVREEGGRFAVCRGQDPRKDQSYVLSRLPQEILSRLLMPLGGRQKSEVRAAAREAGYHAALRPESMEICFLPDGDHAGYIARRFGEMPAGDFVDESGRVLGRHRGILHYTVGQRKGLGIALGERMFVTRIDPVTSTVTLARGGDRGTATLTVRSLVFSGLAPQEEGEATLTVKLRYLAPPVEAQVRFLPGCAAVTLLSPVPAVTPGQSAVFYNGDRVAFSGIID